MSGNAPHPNQHTACKDLNLLSGNTHLGLCGACRAGLHCDYRWGYRLGSPGCARLDLMPLGSSILGVFEQAPHAGCFGGGTPEAVDSEQMNVCLFGDGYAKSMSSVPPNTQAAG